MDIAGDGIDRLSEGRNVTRILQQGGYQDAVSGHKEVTTIVMVSRKVIRKWPRYRGYYSISVTVLLGRKEEMLPRSGQDMEVTLTMMKSRKFTRQWSSYIGYSYYDGKQKGYQEGVKVQRVLLVFYYDGKQKGYQEVVKVWRLRMESRKVTRKWSRYRAYYFYDREVTRTQWKDCWWLGEW